MAYSTDDLSKLSQRERRRLIFLKSASKYRDLGMPIHDNVRFMELIEQWIDGAIEMNEVAARASGFRVVLATRQPPQNAAPISSDGKVTRFQATEDEDVVGVDSDQRPTQDELLQALDALANHGSSDHT
jgi:hypothetical protein